MAMSKKKSTPLSEKQLFTYISQIQAKFTNNPEKLKAYLASDPRFSGLPSWQRSGLPDVILGVKHPSVLSTPGEGRREAQESKEKELKESLGATRSERRDNQKKYAKQKKKEKKEASQKIKREQQHTFSTGASPIPAAILSPTPRSLLTLTQSAPCYQSENDSLLTQSSHVVRMERREEKEKREKEEKEEKEKKKEQKEQKEQEEQQASGTSHTQSMSHTSSTTHTSGTTRATPSSFTILQPHSSASPSPPPPGQASSLGPTFFETTKWLSVFQNVARLHQQQNPALNLNLLLQNLEEEIERIGETRNQVLRISFQRKIKI